MPLFVVLRQDAELDDSLRAEINQKIRKELSPKMVPDAIIEVGEVPRTLNGKKVEVPVKRMLAGESPDQVVALGALENPDSVAALVAAYRAVEG